MNFYSKILLFGEYAIINDAKGLSIPFLNYKGKLAFTKNPNDDQQDSQRSLASFYKFLKHNTTLENLVKIDLECFKKDLENGLYFESSIPQGYGIGSSGALVAAVYDSYCIDKLPPQADCLLRLKEIFSIMENHFHGKSSGLDPLSSYIKKPLLLDSKDQIIVTSCLSKQQSKENQKAVFLINSGKSGKTGGLVSTFFERIKKEREKHVLFDAFIKDTNNCIDAFIKGDMSAFFKHVKDLSGTALKTFDTMIPRSLLDLWKTGIETGSYFLKLCGSGGGGYILGFTDDVEKAKKALRAHKIEIVMLF